MRRWRFGTSKLWEFEGCLAHTISISFNHFLRQAEKTLIIFLSPHSQGRKKSKVKDENWASSVLLSPHPQNRKKPRIKGENWADGVEHKPSEFLSRREKNYQNLRGSCEAYAVCNLSPGKKTQHKRQKRCLQLGMEACATRDPQKAEATALSAANT